MQILIVDDNPNDVLLLKALLERAGHLCQHAANGEAALKALETSVPDLIFSDILMPGMDGFALCRAVKAHPDWQQIPFVFCTATYTDEADAVLALRLGAQRFLTKPVDPGRLTSLLADLASGKTKISIPSDGAALTEPVYLQMYNERLVSKLEENHRKLEATVADLQRQNDRLWYLTHTVQRLNEEAPAARVEYTLVQHTVELVRAETALLVRIEGMDLVLRQAGGSLTGVLEGLVIPLEDGPCSQVVREGGAQALNQTTIPALVDELLLGEVPGSALLAPLAVHGKTIGVLAALHRQPDVFDLIDLQFLQLLANQAATALENAGLIDTLRSQALALQRSQDQLVHNARMATIGRLTAALAHEINNPLQSILGAVQFASELPTSDASRPYLDLAATELERIATVVHRMLGFYRRDDDQRVLTDVNLLLQETLALAEKQLERSRIAVITDLDAHLPRLYLAPNQIKQVFLNLVLNAADAMEKGGRLQVASRQEGNEWVEIRFCDSGPGIGPGDLEHIFEPFYTTKPHGTGLGLAISHDIARQHGGNLLAESAPEQGATFRLLIPCCELPEGEANGKAVDRG